MLSPVEQTKFCALKCRIYYTYCIFQIETRVYLQFDTINTNSQVYN